MTGENTKNKHKFVMSQNGKQEVELSEFLIGKAFCQGHLMSEAASHSVLDRSPRSVLVLRTRGLSLDYQSRWEVRVEIREKRIYEG